MNFLLKMLLWLVLHNLYARENSVTLYIYLHISCYLKVFLVMVISKHVDYVIRYLHL